MAVLECDGNDLFMITDMGRCELTRGRQALELRSNLSERRALTDRIQAPECPVMASTRNLQWSIAHGKIISV